MNNYAESKKQIDKIRSKYSCAGDVLFRTSLQTMIEYGSATFHDEAWFEDQMNFIDERHDLAESLGKHLFMTRDFEKAILECAKELAAIHTYDLMIYIQKEIYLGGDNGPDYQRAIEIIRNCLCYIADCYGAYRLDKEETLDKFECQLDLTEEEIVYFGWEELLEEEEDY